jgi:hypothetical protein
MAEATYKDLGKAREKFDKTVAAAIEEYEKAGAVLITSIIPKRRGDKIEVHVNR